MNRPKPTVRILYLHNMTQISGGERSLLQLWQNMDRQRFEPLLIIPGPGIFSQQAHEAGVKVFYLELPALHPKNTVKLLKAAARLLQLMSQEQIQILHSYSPRNNVLGGLVAKLLGLGVIWHERNMLYQQERDISRRFFFIADRIICNSQAVAKRFEGLRDYSRKVKVILNGVNTKHFKPQNANEELRKQAQLEGFKLIGMVSNLNKRKHVDSLIECLPEIIKKFPQVKLLIIGGEFPESEGRQLAELKDLACRLNVQQHILFSGFQDDVRPYVLLLDVFVHVTPQEACSRAILEAMACAKPVVTINEGGNPELVVEGQTGFLVTQNDRQALVEKIVLLLNSPDVCYQMGWLARQRVEGLFDVKTNASLTQQVYLDLLSHA